jgi:hypothetical protein
VILNFCAKSGRRIGENTRGGKEYDEERNMMKKEMTAYQKEDMCRIPKYVLITLQSRN